MIAAIDQHIADAAGAHFAEGDFLFVASVLELAGSLDALSPFRDSNRADAEGERGRYDSRMIPHYGVLLLAVRCRWV